MRRKPDNVVAAKLSIRGPLRAAGRAIRETVKRA